jgi:hypothetical protein
MHSFDRLVKEETGEDTLNGLFDVGWDEIIHGGGKWEYIGRRTGRENTEALEKASPYLKEAFKTRKAKHDQRTTLMKTIISILSTLVALLRKKKGV